MILADTGVLFGAIDADDPRHPDCADALAANAGQLAVVVPVVVECAWLIESRLGPADEAGFRRFASRNHFASYNGTAPIEVSSGGRVVHRLSRRGSRQLNHAIHIAAITQIRHLHSDGRAYYDRKVAEGKTKKEAMRALKRRISDAIYRQLLADAAGH